MGLLLGIAHEVRSQCPNNAQLSGGATQWTSCACNAGYTNTSGLVNLARACSAGGCTVTGISAYSESNFPGRWLFSNLVDGQVVGGTASGDNGAHTNTQNNDWLMIDLEQTAFINHVQIFNRVACCGFRLNNFQIRVGHSSTFSNNPACVTGEPSFTDVKNFSCVLSGRYVSIQQFNTESMNLREVEVYGRKTSNLARACSAGNCPVTGISQHSVELGVANLVDGGWGMAHTLTGSNDWMMIDMQESVFVAMVRIWNRFDCCTARFYNFEIRVGDSGTSAGSSNPACISNAPSFGGFGAKADFTCVLRGRYVTIQQFNNEVMNLGEMEVFGFKASEVCTACFAGTFKSTTGSAACADCGAGKYQDAAVVTTNPPEAARTYSGACNGDAIGTGHARSMLDSAGAWSAAWGASCTPAAGQWMQIDLGSNFRVHGVVTQCRADQQQWVTEMEVQYSLTTSDFVSARTAGGSTRFFLPTTYSSTLKTSSIFSQPVTARYIKIIVHAWSTYASIRAAVLTLTTTISNACADCGAGKYSTTTGATAAGTCQMCPTGTYVTTTGTTVCTLCPAGKYRDEQAPCAPGFVSMSGDIPDWGSVQGRGGSESVVSCSVCASLCLDFQECGSYECSPTALQCNLNSQTQPTSGAYLDYMFCSKKAEMGCIDCGTGKYSAGIGASTCTACGAGTFSAALGATSVSTCLACPANSHLLSGGTSVSSCVCNLGYTGPNGGACSACAAGKYKAATGTGACTDCGTGKYSATTGTTTASTCQQCGAYTRSTKFQTALLTRGSRYLRCVRSQTSPDMKTPWYGLGNSDANWLDPNVCAGYTYYAFECGYLYCLTSAQLPGDEYIIPDGNCFGQPGLTTSLNSGSNAHCVAGQNAPNTANDGTALGGWHRAAVYRLLDPAIHDCKCDSAGYAGPDGGCAICAAGKFKTSTGSGACTDCGAGMYSGTLGATAASTCQGCSVKYIASNFITDTFAKYPPHLVASAVGWDARKAEFQDWSGNARVGKLTAGAASVKVINNNGAGAGVWVPMVGGGTTAHVDWGSLSVPATFTICSISRYSGATKERILRCVDRNWLHGHWNSATINYAGSTYYEKDMSLEYTISPNTNWVVACGRNSVGLGRSNTIINNVVTSSDKGGTGACRLSINTNNGDWRGVSDWQLSSVYVWNSHLPDDVFARVSADLNAQLAGTVANACAECPAGKFSVDSTRLNCVSCPAGKYKDIAGAQWSFRTDESPYGWQEAYDEAAAAGRRLPTIAELRAYMKSNSSVFEQFRNLDRWTFVVNPSRTNSQDCIQIDPAHINFNEAFYDVFPTSALYSGTGQHLQTYVSVLDLCTDCPAGKVSAAIGASSSGACASCAAGKYQDAVVVVTNPAEAARTYSSISGAGGVQHDKSMLDGTFCWAAGSNTLPQYMQIDLGSSFRVHGVVTQGRFDGDQCVLEMEVQYSLTTSDFVSATALDGTTRFFLPTAHSSHAKTLSNFSQPVTARYIRIYPQQWYNAMSMRAGVLTSLPGSAWNACADCGAGMYSAAAGATTAATCQNCPSNSQSGPGSTTSTSCLCNAGTCCALACACVRVRVLCALCRRAPPRGCRREFNNVISDAPAMLGTRAPLAAVLLLCLAHVENANSMEYFNNTEYPEIPGLPGRRLLQMSSSNSFSSLVAYYNFDDWSNLGKDSNPSATTYPLTSTIVGNTGGHDAQLKPFPLKKVSSSFKATNDGDWLDGSFPAKTIYDNSASGISVSVWFFKKSGTTYDNIYNTFLFHFYNSAYVYVCCNPLPSFAVSLGHYNGVHLINWATTYSTGETHASGCGPAQTLDTWYHLVISLSKTGIFKMYLNGVNLNLVAGDGQNSIRVYGGSAYPVPQFPDVNKLRIFVPSDSKFSGNIDEFAVFNKELSQSEVTELYDMRLYNPDIGYINLARQCVPPGTGGGCTVTGISSVNWEDAALWKLTDGNTATNNHVFTYTGNNDWVMIDLGQERDVFYVRIFNRDDVVQRDANGQVVCCYNRLNNFEIRVGNSATFSNNPACVTGESFFKGNKDFRCVLTGRYVSIQQFNNLLMNLHEVEVYGTLRCSAGKYWTTGGATVAATCLDCGAGKYSAAVGATSADTCLDCGAGKYSTTVGATVAATCLDCAAGKFKTNTGSGACTDCGAGKYQDAVVITTNPPEASRTYESVWGNSLPGTDFARSMLDSAAAWSWTGAFPEWMQIDLGSEFRVHGVVTQCRANYEQCPHEIEVQYSLTASNFVSATAVGGTTRFILPTTWSSTLKSSSILSTPVMARYIRIVVHAGSSFRAGVLTSLPGAAWNTCVDCVAGTYSATAASTCTSCAAGKYSAATASACVDCGVGMFSGTLGATAAATCQGCSVKFHVPHALAGALASYPPHLVADARGWDARKAEFQDWSGNARVGKLTAGAASVSGIAGNGAGTGVWVPLVRGGTTADINWGDVSVPATFTICSVSRYSGAVKGRLLQCSFAQRNWFHGHWAGYAGSTYYGTEVDNYYTISPNTNWVVACGRNTVGVGRSNTIMNNVVTSSNKGGTGNCRMVINSDGSTNEDTDWQLSSVYVWNQHLPDDVFAQVSADLNAQLAGTVGAACAECPAGKFSVDSTRLNCVSCPAGKYKDIAGAQWSFRNDESPYSWQEAYEEAAAAGRRLPTVEEMRAYIKSNPSVFEQFRNLDRWTFVVNPGVSHSKDSIEIDPAHPNFFQTYKDVFGDYPDSVQTGQHLQNYASVLDACTDCPAGTTSAVVGASTASTCVSCAAGKYSDAVVVLTNPPEAARTYSSAYDDAAPGTSNALSMLDSEDAWVSKTTTMPVWMQIDLGSNFIVHGVVTQGRKVEITWIAEKRQHVLEMEVQYSLTTSGFVSATALDGTTRFFLPTAWSSTVKTMSNFSQPVTARYIRIYPQRWNDWISMRAAVLTSLPSAAWNACADCVAGKYSATLGATTAGTCQSCLTNAQSATGSDAATDCVCVAGYSGPDGGTCTACGVGKYKTAAGSFGCTNCSAGLYSTTIGATALDQCSFCWYGKFSVAGASVCTECIPGKFSPGYPFPCEDCEAGKYSVSGVTWACLTCAAGKYSSASASVCTECSAGKYTKDGLTCVTCLYSKYAVAGASVCTECVPGKYTLGEGQTSISACIDCAAGKYSENEICRHCPAGKYSAAVSSVCTNCGPNTYSPTVGATGVDTCLACPAGSLPAGFDSRAGSDALEDCFVQECAPGSTGLDGGTCTACAAGKYKTVPGSATCTDCSAGTYSTTIGATAMATCTTCPSNSQSSPGSTALTSCVCKEGFTGPNGGTCAACAVGKYKVATGSAACIDHPPATCTSGNRPDSVSAGSYKDTLFSSNAVCKCAAGFTGPDGGPCIACAAGFYKATVGSTACTDCSTSSSCQCAAGTTATTPTLPALNPARDAVTPNWCTTTAGVPIMQSPLIRPYAPGALLYERCIPPVVRDHIDFPSAVCDFLIIISYVAENPRIYYIDVPCSTVIVAPGHIRIIVNNTLNFQPSNPSTFGKPFPNITNQHSWRVFSNFLKTPRTSYVTNQQCGGSLCISLCPTTSVATDPCYNDFSLSAFAYPMLWAEPVSKLRFERTASGSGGTSVTINWERIPSSERGYPNPPPTSLYLIEAYVVQFDTTVKFDTATRITKEILSGTYDFDERVVVISGLDPTKTYFMRMAGRTIIGEGKFAGPFFVPFTNTEVPFESSSMCEQCAVGTYKTSSTRFNETCNACPVNTTSVSGSSSVNNCLCQPGFVGQAGGPCQFLVCAVGMTESSPMKCSSCAAGTFKDTEGSVACTVCPSGTTSQAGSDAATDCVCVAGFSGPNGGPCTSCGAGKYKTLAGSAACTDCLSNSYHDLTGRTAASACLCNAGTLLVCRS